MNTIETEELKSVFADLLGEPNAEWRLVELVTAWSKRTGKPFRDGSALINGMWRSGEVAIIGQRVELIKGGII
ncbi:MAG TPA: hypothetical protein VNQ90_02745 [Chthoniobacteraceae bacterium]|nr:hypothetical protein [Chthoniobacteraceae bacterium]